MALRFWLGTGGDALWSNINNWAATSGGTAGVAVPLNTDDVTFDAAGNNPCTLNTSARVCKSLTVNGYTNTITFDQQLSVSGSITFTTTGFSFAGATTNRLRQITTGTWTTNGKTIPQNVEIGGTTTFTCTLADALTTSGSLFLTNTTSTPFSGSFTINAADCTISGSQTITINANVNITGLTTIADANVINNGSFNWNTGGLTTTGALSGTAMIVLTGGTWTGAAGTLSSNLTFNGNSTVSGTVLYATGTITWTSGTITTTGSTLSIGVSCTLNTAGMTWDSITITLAITLTINSLLTATGTLTMPNGACTLAGTAGFTVGTLTNTAINVTRTWTFTAGNTYTITTAFTTVHVAAQTVRFTMTAASSANFVLAPGATQNIGFVDPTNLDASTGQTIFTFHGVITASPNWSAVLPVNVLPAQGFRVLVNSSYSMARLGRRQAFKPILRTIPLAVAGGAQDLALAPVSVPVTPQALTATAGAVTAALTPTSVPLVPVVLAQTVGAVSLTLAPVAIPVAAQTLSPTAAATPALTPVQVPLTPNALTANAGGVAAALAPVAIPVVPITLDRTATASLTLTPTTVALTAQVLALTPGGVSPAMSPATISTVALTLTSSAAVSLTTTPVTIATTPEVLGVTPGATSMALVPVPVEVVPLQVNVSLAGGANLTLDPATVTVEPVASGVTTGGVSAALSPVAISVTPVPVAPVAGAADLTLTPAVIPTVPNVLGVDATGATSLALSPVTIVLTAGALGMTLGATSIALAPASVSTQAVTLGPATAVTIVLGVVTIPLTANPLGIATAGATSLALSPAVVTLTGSTLGVTGSTPTRPVVVYDIPGLPDDLVSVGQRGNGTLAPAYAGTLANPHGPVRTLPKPWDGETLADATKERV